MLPSPGSFVASFRENPAARADASRGRFAVLLFANPSDDDVVYDESDSEPESVSESELYGVYLVWFILLFMSEVLFRGSLPRPPCPHFWGGRCHAPRAPPKRGSLHILSHTN